MKKFGALLLAVSISAQGCSIVGYVGNNLCKKFVLHGLSQLEYRGYDSAGFACLNPENNRLVCIKATGRLQNLVNKLMRDPIDSCIAIGHTRWATHGPATEENAHPHIDCLNSLAIAHNGIIENYFHLRQQLIHEGHVFRSTTDTEVIAHVCEKLFAQELSLKDTGIKAAEQLKGSYAFVCLSQKYPDTLLVVRKSSPACIGIGEGEMFVASDILAFIHKTNKVVYLPDQSFALVTKDAIRLFDFSGKELSVEVKISDVSATAQDKGNQEHFMLKEIYEQRNAINSSVNFYKSIKDNIEAYVGVSRQFLKDLKSINIVSCGTSWHAGRIGQFFFETKCNIPVHVHLASEFRYMPFIPEDHCLYLFVSQSGETADTLEAMRQVNRHGLPTLAITNVASSTMAREAKGCLQTVAGPEIAVASTKSFSTQLTALYWLACLCALEKGVINADQLTQEEDTLIAMADALDDALTKNKDVIINQLAKQYAQYHRFFFLGRHVGYPFAMEAALKLKEIAYVFALGFPAGELKHGSIALIDPQTPSILFSSTDPVIYSKLVANAQEIKARNGHLLAFAFEGQQELIRLADEAVVLPQVPVLLEPFALTGVMQFLVYRIAHELGREIDKPRNLAKAVTVE